MKRYIKIFLSVGSLMILILDVQTAIKGIQDALDVCIRSVIPSLLPFLILSKYITGNMIGVKIPLISRIGESCGIPAGLDSILGIGWIGGYPTGAQAIKDAYRKKCIDRVTAQKILGFCNNAGPAFIFGISASLFTKKWIGWIVFLIQIISSILVGLMIPIKRTVEKKKMPESTITLIESVEKGIKSMALICGWILCFRIILTYINRYLLVHDPFVEVFISGVLELSNGCLSLGMLDSEAAKFIILNGMLSFGGICVWMQTKAVSDGLKLKWFIVGRCLQCIISTTLAYIAQIWLFPADHIGHWLIPMLLTTIVICFEILCFNQKIIVASWRQIMYNSSKKCEKRDLYAVSQAD